MPEMLKQLQDHFAQALISSGEQPELHDLIQDSHFAADQLLQIYRNNFVLSLTEALEATFPVLKEMVGEEFFAQLAKAFIRQIPLEHASIATFGEQLPEFMTDLEQLTEMRYLVDLARFEWLYSWHINRMPQADVFPYESLAELTYQDYENLAFQLNPDMSLFQSQWAIIELFQRIKQWQSKSCCGDESDPLSGFDLSIAQSGWIKTVGLAKVDIQQADTDNFVFLTHCLQQQIFAQLDNENAEQNLQQGIASGLITGFQLLEVSSS
jgi:hypothetical protein